MSTTENPHESGDESQPAGTASDSALSNNQGVTDKLSAAQGTENFIETYHAISEWIRFADAKAAVILTVGGALAGFLIPTVQAIISDPESRSDSYRWRCTRRISDSDSSGNYF